MRRGCDGAWPIRKKSACERRRSSLRGTNVTIVWCCRKGTSRRCREANDSSQGTRQILILVQRLPGFLLRRDGNSMRRKRQPFGPFARNSGRIGSGKDLLAPRPNHIEEQNTGQREDHAR